ncbi:MAG TPA: hypothetical protein VKU42_04360 [Candidatus Angelobacter sp.]|nr:hypothetical protein [Candidatus Angelobacter sp.]
MNDIWQRVVGNLFGRLDGPLHFRFILQPLMAMILAMIGGIKDARLGKPPYLWGALADPGYRKEFLKDGWKHVGRIFALAIVLELIYQPYVLHAFYPGEMLVVAFVLAIVPYVLVRGPANRIARLFTKKESITASAPAEVGSRIKRKSA